MSDYDFTPPSRQRDHDDDTVEARLAQRAQAREAPLFNETIWRKVFDDKEVWTRWKNDTDSKMTWVHHIGIQRERLVDDYSRPKPFFYYPTKSPTEPKVPITAIRFELMPGAEIALPKEVADSLRTIKDGKVVGGKGPRITALDLPNYPLDKCFAVPTGWREGMNLEMEKALYKRDQQKEIDNLLKEVK